LFRYFKGLQSSFNSADKFVCRYRQYEIQAKLDTGDEVAIKTLTLGFKGHVLIIMTAGKENSADAVFP
jgi:hypothetical protein